MTRGKKVIIKLLGVKVQLMKNMWQRCNLTINSVKGSKWENNSVLVMQNKFIKRPLKICAETEIAEETPETEPES